MAALNILLRKAKISTSILKLKIIDRMICITQYRTVALLLIYRSGRLIGTTDDGYSFPAIVVPGSIKAGKTLEYKTSWYSNPYHKDSLLNAGSYTVKIDPYIRFTDFDLKKNLKTITFTVTD